jgi:ketosteroid isomerase-like protein
MAHTGWRPFSSQKPSSSNCEDAPTRAAILRHINPPAGLLNIVWNKEEHLMSKHVTITPAEAADRLAIRELVEAYAHCADRRDAKGQMALFTEDTHFVVFMNATDPKPSQELHSRAALAPVFDDLNKYAATMHFVGQSTILTLSRDRATGEAYTLAHHLTVAGTKRSLMVAALRYGDTFVKKDGAWLFAERNLYVDWIEERSLS